MKETTTTIIIIYVTKNTMLPGEKKRGIQK